MKLCEGRHSESRSSQCCFPEGSHHCSSDAILEGWERERDVRKIDPVCSKWEVQESHYAIFSRKQLSARPGKAWYSAVCRIWDVTAAGSGDLVTRESVSLGSLALAKRVRSIWLGLLQTLVMYCPVFVLGNTWNLGSCSHEVLIFVEKERILGQNWSLSIALIFSLKRGNKI